MRKVRAAIGVLFALVVVLVIVVVAVSGGGGPSAKITHKVYSVIVLDAQHVRVFTTWHNIGKGAGSASCVMDVTAFNAYGDEIGSGADSTGTNSLAPGQSVNIYQDIVVTDNHAAGVTSPTDVSITDCGASTSSGSSATSVTATSVTGNTGTALSGNSDACPSKGLTGFGATQKVWNECQGPDLRDCPDDSCAGPLTTAGGVEETFIEVELAGGRVIGYTQTLPEPMGIAQAETAALQLFPSDVHEVATGIATSSDGETCRWVNYQSATVGNFYLEFAHANNTNGNWTYEPSNINQVFAATFAYSPGNGC